MDKPHALIIEDDRNIVALFRHILDVNGYHTEACFHGTLARERLKECSPDLIVLDLKLPGVTGTELIQQIGSSEHLLRTPIVVVTAFSEIAEGLPVKPDLILYKPVDLNQFITLVHRVRAEFPNQADFSPPVSPFDESTGLYNREFFNNRLDCALRNAKKISSYHFALLTISLMNIHRSFNAGRTEELDLHKLALVLKNNLRVTDTLAYVEPMCMIALLDDIPGERLVRMVANRVQDALNKAVLEMHPPYRLVDSVGILLCDSDYGSSEEALADAILVLKKINSNAENCKVLYKRGLLAIDKLAEKHE